MARKFDFRERDKECLRVALRLKDPNRAFVARLAREQNKKPSVIVGELVTSMRKTFERVLREVDKL